MSPRKKAAPAPVRRTSAALADIPRRTRVWAVVHVDPLADEVTPTREEYLPRAERRARARHAGRQMVPGALEPYQTGVAA